MEFLNTHQPPYRRWQTHTHTHLRNIAPHTKTHTHIQANTDSHTYKNTPTTIQALVNTNTHHRHTLHHAVLLIYLQRQTHGPEPTEINEHKCAQKKETKTITNISTFSH